MSFSQEVIDGSTLGQVIKRKTATKWLMMLVKAYYYKFIITQDVILISVSILRATRAFFSLPQIKERKGP